MGAARLWRAALGLFLADAMYHHCGRPTRQGGSQPEDLAEICQAAFDDLTRCGPMVRWLCDHVEIEAEYLSEKFNRWIHEQSAFAVEKR